MSFCWECGKKLYQGKVHETRVVEGHERILHKRCAELIDEGKREPFYDEEEIDIDRGHHQSELFGEEE